MALALEGGYNASVTNACCEAVVRALVDDNAGEPPPPLPRPSRSCEPTLRAVLRVHQPLWPTTLANADALFDAYFQHASEVGAPNRASKRRKTKSQ